MQSAIESTGGYGAFDASVWELWPSLTAGASVHVPCDHVRGEPRALRDWLVGERITVSFLPTARPTEASLRYLLTGGDT